MDLLEQNPTATVTFVVQATFVLETFVYTMSILANINPILTKYFGVNFLCGFNFWGPKFFLSTIFWGPKNFWILLPSSV